RWIEIGLEAFDPVEVGTGSDALDVAQPLVAHLGKGATEVYLAQPPVRARHRLGCQHDFRRRKDPRGRNGTHRTLRFHLELAQRLELVAKEFTAQWPPPVGREAIEDAAAHAELAASLHERFPA